MALDRPRIASGGLAHALRARHAQRSGDPGQFLRLDRVQLVIAAQDEGDHIARAAFDQQRLHAPRRRDFEKLRELGNGAGMRVGTFASACEAAGRGAAEGSVAALSTLAA